jgi:rare lipoprotein A
VRLLGLFFTVVLGATATMVAPAASRGFAYFFAHTTRPEAACSGHLVVASWYGSGHRTASGAPFNVYGMTAAHRTLPFGSQVMVSNPKNGRSVSVVINDRGPFTHGVTLDLARGAAQAIGMRETQWVCMN